MKTGTSHLPESKQAELAIVLQEILEVVQPLMVILFGSYGRGDFVEDRYTENGTTYEYKSDYDLLVITDKDNLLVGTGKRLRKKVRRSEVQTPLGLIFHSIDFVNKELSSGNYFFTDIVKEGCMLFDDGTFSLADPVPLSAEEGRKKAAEYFEVWFKEASGFLKMYEFGKDSGLLNQAIFMLHQAAERFYNTLLLVVNDYKPKVHDLEELNYQARIIDSRFKAVFLRSSPEDERLFQLLKKAYIDARYKHGYSVSESDLLYLAERVEMLRDLVKDVCLKRLGKK